MANVNPDTLIYARKMILRSQGFLPSAMFHTLDTQYVDIAQSQSGAQIEIESLDATTADTLATSGAIVATDVGTATESLTLSGKQKVYVISDQEYANTAYLLDKAVNMKSVDACFEAVENGLGDFMNLNVRQVAGSASSAIDSLDDVTAAAAVLDSFKTPQIGRWAALKSTAYQKLVGTVALAGAEVQNNEKVIRQGDLSVQSNLQYINSVYSARAFTNGTFGAGALAIKGTVAAGLTAIIIDGVTVSETGAIIAGTVISIAHTGGTKNYVVQAAADSDGSGDVPLTISPALEEEATDNDVVVVLTGASAATYTKNYVYGTDFAGAASRATAIAKSGPVYETVPRIVPGLGWVLTTLNSVNTGSWGQNNVGASTLFGFGVQHPDYAVVLLSS